MSETNWPADTVHKLPIDTLEAYARNSRLHSDEQVAQIAASIKEFGWTIPVLVDDDGVLIAGHGRVLAARALGIEEVPALIARGWSDERKRAYRIADNALPLNASWDQIALKLEIGDLQTAGFDLNLTGFDDRELDQIFAGGAVDPEKEWEGMPEFDQPDATAFRSIVVHLKDQAAVDAFAAAIGQKFTEKTKFAWYPRIEIETYVDKRYAT